MQSAPALALSPHEAARVAWEKRVLVPVFVVILALPMRHAVFPLSYVFVTVFVPHVFTLSFVKAGQRKRSADMGSAGLGLDCEMDYVLFSESLDSKLGFLVSEAVNEFELSPAAESALLELSNVGLPISEDHDRSALKVAIVDRSSKEQRIKVITNMNVLVGGQAECGFFGGEVADAVEFLLDGL